MPILALLLLTAVRLAVAASAPLAPDETYYWIWSRALAPGYLDHPPMVALWIWLGTALAGETALGVRLLGPLAAAVGSLMLVDAANRLYPARRPGVAAAILLNATLMLGAGAVTMTPDTPLLFFAVMTLWALARVEHDPRWWLVAGFAIGAGLDSK
ncbi:MAG: glycosyltransferase family 39 protein, partial [Alphaproteobacteria bacterium]